MTLTDIQVKLNIPRTTIRDRIYSLGIEGSKISETKNILTYSEDEVKLILESFNHFYKPSTEARESKGKTEFIYIDRKVKETETYFFFHSIGNFLTIEQLENYEKNN